MDRNDLHKSLESHRLHRAVSADGPRNIIDGVDYILSRAWADVGGSDALGAVLVESERIIASRQVRKADARPGGYIATGDHGGVLGTIGFPGPVTIYFEPRTRHTWKSQVRLSELPASVNGVIESDGVIGARVVTVKDDDGDLVGESIPRVSMVKKVHFEQRSSSAEPDDEVDIMARIDAHSRSDPLAGFVAEGASPYGNMTQAQTNALTIAAYSGMPVVSVGSGNAGGLTATRTYNVFIEGNNLTSTKARLLLMASMLKLGSLPAAKDPKNPTASETRAVQEAIDRYQSIFDTH